jgi:hypothetical protein
VPTVPTLEQPSVAQEPLPGRAYPRIQDSVPEGSFGEGLERGINDLSSVMTAEQAREKVQNDNLRVIDANTQLEAGRNALLYGQPDKNGVMQGGAFSLHGTDAINLPNRLMPEYQKLADKISSSLTPDQQRIFYSHVAAGKNELNIQLNRYEYEESNRLANQVYSNGAKQAVESASVGWRDPIVIGKSRADIKALVQLQGDREGWPQDERDAQTQKFLAEMHYSVVDRMLADGRPQAALQYFVGTKQHPGIRDSNELTGEQSHQIGAAIDAALRQQSAQVEASVSARVRDVRAAAINGQMVPPSSMPTDGELRAAYPDTWQTVKSGIQSDIRMGADLKSFAGLTPAELRQHVESYQPSGVTGAAEGYERYNAAAVAAQKVMAERAKDPRQFAIDNQLGSHPLNFGDAGEMGAELRQRLASTPQLSRQMGGYVEPLSRAEAARLAQSLESMKPTDRLKALSVLQSTVNDDRGFQAIMHQVLPGSPVTAIVGAQVGQANPREAPVWFDHRFAPRPDDQARILQGEALLNPQGLEKGEESGRAGKKAFPMPSDDGPSGLREQYANRVGNLFRGRPELSEDYFQAFKGAYAQMLAEKGDLSGNGSAKLRDQALDLVLGHTVDFNGQQVAVPPGMDPSRFQGLLHNAIAGRAHTQGAPEGWEDKIRGFQLRELGGLGSGQYQLVQGNVPLIAPDRKGPFQIDLVNQYRPSMGGRGSTEDVARAAQAPARESQPTAIEPGQSAVAKSTPEPKALKAPPLAAGGRRGGKARPSQGEPPEL